MKIANRQGKAVLVSHDGASYVDVASASNGAFSGSPMEIFERWSEFTAWAAGADFAAAAPLDAATLEAPVPAPRQVFALGTNYLEHVKEAGWPVPEVPLVFTKFSSSVAGPNAVIEISGPRVDWEVEAVVVIGAPAWRVKAADAWSHVAGVTIGQDYSDRDTQQRPETYPQFSLGKSYPGYTTIGPLLVTPDEFENPNDIRVQTRLNGELVQDGSTADLIFSVADTIEYLSHIVTLLPGDLIFTGTPSGVGAGMTPPRFLQASDTITSIAPVIGEMSQTFTEQQES